MSRYDYYDYAKELPSASRWECAKGVFNGGRDLVSKSTAREELRDRDRKIERLETAADKLLRVTDRLIPFTPQEFHEPLREAVRTARLG